MLIRGDPKDTRRRIWDSTKGTEVTEEDQGRTTGDRGGLRVFERNNGIEGTLQENPANMTAFKGDAAAANGLQRDAALVR